MPLETQIDKGKKVVTETPPYIVSTIVWENEKEKEVLENIRSDRFKFSLNSALKCLNSCTDSSVKFFTQALLKSAECMRQTYTHAYLTNGNHSSWFDGDCRNAKQKFKKTLLLYDKTPSQALN